MTVSQKRLMQFEVCTKTLVLFPTVSWGVYLAWYSATAPWCIDPGPCGCVRDAVPECEWSHGQDSPHYTTWRYTTAGLLLDNQQRRRSYRHKRKPVSQRTFTQNYKKDFSLLPLQVYVMRGLWVELLSTEEILPKKTKLFSLQTVREAAFVIYIF